MRKAGNWQLAGTATREGRRFLAIYNNGFFILHDERVSFDVHPDSPRVVRMQCVHLRNRSAAHNTAAT
jgi:hypothetical protein